MAQPKAYHTPTEYLVLERASSVKHEYFAGTIYMMAGGSARHTLIAGNTYASLHGQLRKRPCIVYPSDLRVKVLPSGLYTYPDITIVCGTPQFEDEHEDTLLNPTIIIEVLSPSTEKYDRGKKFQNYRMLWSLREYILIAQDEWHIERFVRQSDNQWLFSEAMQLEEQIELTAIQCTLTVSDVYEKVHFPVSGEEE